MSLAVAVAAGRPVAMAMIALVLPLRISNFFSRLSLLMASSITLVDRRKFAASLPPSLPLLDLSFKYSAIH